MKALIGYNNIRACVEDLPKRRKRGKITFSKEEVELQFLHLINRNMQCLSYLLGILALVRLFAQSDKKTKLEKYAVVL